VGVITGIFAGVAVGAIIDGAGVCVDVGVTCVSVTVGATIGLIEAVSIGVAVASAVGVGAGGDVSVGVDVAVAVGVNVVVGVGVSVTDDIAHRNPLSWVLSLLSLLSRLAERNRL
jgi:hypothetical protein